MGYYPIAFDVTNRPCLIIGGGVIGLRKAEVLSRSGARVTLISPEIDPRIESIDGIEIRRRAYQPGDTKSFALVFAATGDRDVNLRISEEARANGIPINVVDDPELCSFIVPSVVRRGDLMICTTTSGKAPGLSKRLRRVIEDAVGEEYGAYVALLGELRDRVRTLYNTQPEREAAMNRVLDNPEVLDLIRQEKAEEARESALRCI